MTDYKQLCVELLDSAEELDDLIEGIRLGDYTPDSFTLQPMRAVLDRARAALAEPEPEGPTDEELRQLRREREWPVVDSVLFAITRAVLARWGSPAPQPPAPWQWLSEARPREGQQCEWVLLAPWGTNSGSGEWVVIDSDVNSGAHFNSSLGRIAVTGFRCEKGLAVTDPAITAWRSIT